MTALALKLIGKASPASLLLGLHTTKEVIGCTHRVTWQDWLAP